MRRNHANGTGFDAVPPAPVPTTIGGRSIDQSVALGVTLISPRRIMRRHDLPFQRIGLVSLALRPWTLKCSGSEGSSVTAYLATLTLPPHPVCGCPD